MVLLRVKGAGLAFLGVVCGFCFWALRRGIRMIEDVGYYGYLGFRAQDFIAGFDISSFGFQAGSQFTCLRLARGVEPSSECSHQGVGQDAVRDFQTFRVQGSSNGLPLSTRRLVLARAPKP